MSRYQNYVTISFFFLVFKKASMHSIFSPIAIPFFLFCPCSSNPANISFKSLGTLTKTYLWSATDRNLPCFVPPRRNVGVCYPLKGCINMGQLQVWNPPITQQLRNFQISSAIYTPTTSSTPPHSLTHSSQPLFHLVRSNCREI